MLVIQEKQGKAVHMCKEVPAMAPSFQCVLGKKTYLFNFNPIFSYSQENIFMFSGKKITISAGWIKIRKCLEVLFSMLTSPVYEALPGLDLGPGLDLLVVQEGRHVLAQLQITGLRPDAGSGRSDGGF